MKQRASIVLFAALALSALSLGACRSKSTDSTDKKPEAVTASTADDKASARVKPPPVDEGIDVPTEEDFEDATSAQITDTSDLQKELDQLEKEIGK